MKINLNTSGLNGFNSPSFRAGVTNIFSDFDGTFMPEEFRQDSLVKNTPVLNEEKFATYFKNFQKLIDELRGKKTKSKLNFSIITGRNIHEFNYIAQRVRQRGLKIPLPDSLITSNGADIYIKTNPDNEFYSGRIPVPYFMADADKEKIEWVRKNADNWDGDEVEKQLIQILNKTNIIPRNQKREELFKKILVNLDDAGKKDWYKNLMALSGNQQELTDYIMQAASPFLDISSLEDKQRLISEINEVASGLYSAKNGKYKFQILKSGTNQCSWTYPSTDITMQSQYEGMINKPRYYVSFRDDGKLNFHLAFPWVAKKENFNSFNYDLLEPEFVFDGVTSEALHSSFAGNNITKVNLDANAKTDGEAFNAYGDRTSAFRLRPKLTLKGGFLENGGVLDKMHDVQRRAKEIVDNNLNDLVIASGDGSNDIKMLDLASYMSFDKMDWNNKDAVRELKKLPIVSIFVKNKDIKGFNPYEVEELYNADGVVRYIVVDANNPARPQNLQEAIEVAVKEHAKNNPEFRNNLSDEMLERISKNTFEYPVKVLFDENNLANVVKNKKKILFPILLFAALGTSVAAFLKIKKSKAAKENLGNSNNSVELEKSKTFIAFDDFIKLNKK